MNRYGSSEDHQPVTWLGEYPIYAAHFVVLVLVGAMLGTTLLMFLKAGYILDWLPFVSPRVLAGEAWRVLTYGLVNPPSLWFAIDMAMLVWFGRELEKFFGRRTFLALYAGLYFLPPLLFTLVGLWRPIHLAGESGASFAVFIAFATLYPNAVMIFNVLAKWVAAILVGIYTLMALSNRDVVGLISLWATAGFAYAFVRYQQGHLAFPSFSLGSRHPNLRALPDPKSEKNRRAAAPKESSMAEVDALLDKIARSGMSSLTLKERARLDAAREDLRKKESGRR